jgi:hypothetical protein
LKIVDEVRDRKANEIGGSSSNKYDLIELNVVAAT